MRLFKLGCDDCDCVSSVCGGGGGKSGDVMLLTVKFGDDSLLVDDAVSDEVE